MNSDSWDAVSAQIRKSILAERSILSQFPPEAACITTREIVLSLTADCPCRKSLSGAAAPLELASTAVPSQQRRPLGRHATGISVTKASALNRSTMEAGETMDARSRRFSVKLDTDADLQWVMQAINYGLVMPPEYWDIVTHSVHLYCEWLGCLLPAQGQRVAHLPHALLTNPITYSHRLFCALARFFAPRAPADYPTDGLFTLFHRPPRDPPSPASVAAAIDSAGAAEDSARGITMGTVQSSVGLIAGEGESWLQEMYIPLVSCIVNRVEQILYTSHLLTGPLWDHMLEFCLVICFAVLSPPPQIECSVVTASRPFSQSPGVRGMLQLECLVVGLLSRVWMRALYLHHPAPAYWAGLQELFQVSRHRVGLSYIWSRVLVIFTGNLLVSHFGTDVSPRSGAPPLSTILNPPSLSALQPLLGHQLRLDISEEIAQTSWFRLFHLFGNPVDLCHPTEVAHTAVFEYFRRANAAPRCRLAAAFLPVIFHHVMRSFSTIVDLFLGITPSLSSFLSTFVGVPPDLYGPLVDVGEYFQYASVRTPDTLFLDKPRVGGDVAGTTEPPPPPDSAVQTATTSLSTLVRNAGLSSSLINPQTLAEAWLKPDLMVTCFYNQPYVESLLKLLGPWLFEAALGRSKGAIISKRSLKVDSDSFLVGRAEAMATLCRIFIYARKKQIDLDSLTRFYVCLVKALDPEVEYVLSTVLFHAPDLLRADLTASFTVLAPTLFNITLWVLRKPSVICPEYVSMVLLRRASLHQLLSMVCLSSQFDCIQFQEINSISTADSGVSTTRALRMKLATLLCDLLTHETDPHNLRMLLSAAYTLVLDMISVELSGVDSRSKLPLSPDSSNPPQSVKTASNLHGLLLEKISTSLRLWMNDFIVSSFALDILSGLATTPLPQPSMTLGRRCIQSICAFIEAHIRREKKDYTRVLHNIIVNAFQCLGVWLVAHPTAPNDLDILRTVVETTKLGIFSSETSTSASSVSRVIGSRENLLLSKRVNEAAEHLLTTLFSTASSFSNASRSETSCRLTEEHVVKLATTSTFQHFLVSLSNSCTTSASYLTTPDLLLSIAETSQRPSDTGNFEIEYGSTLPRSVADPSPVFTFFRDASGRHLWSWKLRYRPRNANGSEASATATLRPRDRRSWKSCLENSWPIRKSGEAEDPFMPRTRATIPLVRAEREMPTLAQSVFDPVARREVDALKSLIALEVERDSALGRRICEARIKAFSSRSEGLCRPERRADQISSGHLLACHLGFVPVNALQASTNSFRVNSSKGITNQSQSPATTNACRRPTSGILVEDRRILGTRDFGGGLDANSLIPSALTPIDSLLAKQLDSQLLAFQRFTATVFVFYVKRGQTALTDVIANTDSWTEMPKDFLSFVRSLGWCVNAARHPGGCKALRRTSDLYSSDVGLSPIDVHQNPPSSGGAADGCRRSAPDGIDAFFYWSDSSTEVVTLCPSKRTEIDLSEKYSSAHDFRAALLWLESWDDALWVSGWATEGGTTETLSSSTTSTPSNPLQTALATQFACSLVILVHPLATNGLYRIGLLRPHDLGHEAGPLTTGLLLSLPLLGAMVRSTLANTLRRLAADSGEPATAAVRNRLAAVEKGRAASAVELLLRSSEWCY